MSKMWRQTRTSGGRRLFRRDIEEKLKETASPFFQRRKTRTTGCTRRNPRSPEPVCDIDFGGLLAQFADSEGGHCSVSSLLCAGPEARTLVLIDGLRAFSLILLRDLNEMAFRGTVYRSEN